LLNFGALSLNLFPARQVPEIMLNEYSRNTENASFIGQFFFQHDVFKLQEVFLKHGIRVCIDNGLGSFQTLIV
jgi:hypothetical protein